MTYRFSTLADYISMKNLRRYDMSHYLRSTCFNVTRSFAAEWFGPQATCSLCSIWTPVCSTWPLFTRAWGRPPGCTVEKALRMFLTSCRDFHVARRSVVTVCTFLVLPQVPALLLLCGAQPDQHRRSAGAHYDLWDFISDDKLLHWRLCVLQFDWTGRVRRLCKGLRSDLFVLEWATFLSFRWEMWSVQPRQERRILGHPWTAVLATWIGTPSQNLSRTESEPGTTTHGQHRACWVRILPLI